MKYQQIEINRLRNVIREDAETIKQLKKSLHFLVEAAETEPAMSIYKAHINQAKELMREC